MQKNLRLVTIHITWAQHLAIWLFVLMGSALAIYDFLQLPVLTPTVLSSPLLEAVDREPIQPLPRSLALDPAKVALGEKLYHDPRLSGDNTVSCATCHDLGKGGTDQRRYSVGIGQALGGINSPTTFNSGFNFVQFWDGRAATLAEQAAGPVHNPVEMGSNWPEVIAKLSKVPEYRQAFQTAYAEGITPDNITDAIAVFEQSLITPNAPFDRYLAGDAHAISDEAKEGYRLFKEHGCIACHQGINIGGNMYQTIGVMEDYFQHRKTTKADLGRYNVTSKSWNIYQFKVPTLRNIALTHPYLHDGTAATLEAVMEVMWSNQLGRKLHPSEGRMIIAFLNTLTGEFRGKPL